MKIRHIFCVVISLILIMNIIPFAVISLGSSDDLPGINESGDMEKNGIGQIIMNIALYVVGVAAFSAAAFFGVRMYSHTDEAKARKAKELEEKKKRAAEKSDAQSAEDEIREEHRSFWR